MKVSIWLGNSGIRRRLKCVVCGKTVHEIAGEVVQLTAGNVQEEQGTRAVITRCKGCKTEYSFMG